MIIQTLARRLMAQRNILAQGRGMDDHYYQQHQDVIDRILAEMPEGGGFGKASIDLSSTNDPANEVVINTPYHHMDESGYIGWTHYILRVKPNFVTDFSIDIDWNRDDEVFGVATCDEDGEEYSVNHSEDDAEYVAEVFTDFLAQDFSSISA